MPTDAQVSEALSAYFFVDRDPEFVLRARLVGEAVAVALGLTWSPALGVIVRRCVEAMGAISISFCNVRLFKGFRARHLDDAAALKLSAKLRRKKT